MIFEKLGVTSTACLSLIGAFLIKFSTATITTWGNINLYILSYFYHQGHDITESTNPIIILLTVIPMVFATLSTTRLCKRFGNQTVIRVCAIIFCLSPLVTAMAFNFYVFVVFSIMIPASSFAIIAIPVLNCMWATFPDSRNRITAILVVSYGVGSMVWNAVFMHLINPNNHDASLKEGDMSFFPTDVTDNVRRSTFIGYLISGILNVIGAFLISKPQSNNTGSNDRNQLNEEMKMENAANKNEDGNTPKSEQEFIPQIEQLNHNLQVKKALKDPRFILIFLISFFISLYEIHLIMNLKIIYMPILNDDHFLTYASILCSVVSIAATFIWGFLGDRRGVAYSILIMAIIDFGTKIYSNFAMTKPTIIIMMILIGILSKSIATLAGPGFVQFFGLEIGTEMVPYKAVAILAGFLLVPLFQVITASVLTPHHYLIILSFFSILTLVMASRLYRIGKRSSKSQEN